MSHLYMGQSPHQSMMQSPHRVLSGEKLISISNNLQTGARQVNYFITEAGIYAGWFTPGTAGTPLQLIATGATDPVVWNISRGALPAGMSLSSSGILSGAPTEEFTIEDCAIGGGPSMRKLYQFRTRATDALGLHYGQDVVFPVYFSVRAQVYSITYPTGTTLTSGPGAGYDTIGSVFDTFTTGDGGIRLGAVYTLAGTVLVPGNISPPADLVISTGTGLGSWRQADGSWTSVLTVGVRIPVGLNNWNGVISYDLNELSLYGTKTANVSRWMGTINGTDMVDPPFTDGSATVVFS